MYRLVLIILSLVTFHSAFAVIDKSQLQKLFQKNILNTFDTLKPPVKNIAIPSIVVVIDPGHGGKDTGAIGSNGVKEKDIVLGIAKKLANKLNQQPNIKAVLTRTDDYFIPLRQRLRIARKKNADLFIAIHADAHFDHTAMGVSVFALSQRAASNEAARWLAQQENYSELDGVELNALSDRDPILRSVLVDLSQATTIQDSLHLGNKVLNALDDISALHYKRVERAPFVVLKSPDIPSILVETGFITNPREESRLMNAAYQHKIAQALQQGIMQYVRSNARSAYLKNRKSIP